MSLSPAGERATASTGACRTAWDKIIRAQLDARTKPCNLAMLRPRLHEAE